MADLDCLAWSAPARLTVSPVHVAAGKTATALELGGGRWSRLHLRLRAPAAWATLGAGHSLRILARDGQITSEAWSGTLERLHWRTLGSQAEASITVDGCPAEAFAAELTAGAAGLTGGTLVAVVHGTGSEPAAIVADRLDRVLPARSGPLGALVMYGLDPSGELRPIAVSSLGVM